MRRSFSLLTVLTAALVPPAARAQEPALIAPTDPRTPEDERRGFRLPPGFEAQLVASEPRIGKPINMAFDAKGRLWVTTSREYPFPAQGRAGRDVLAVLDRIGPDGKAGRITKFADDLNIPIGLLPLPDCKRTLVYSIPDVWQMTDADGDGRADRREALVGAFGHRDTHGMVNSLTLGFDGWVYADHGFSNDSTVKGKDGSTLHMQSGNTWRFRPNGTHIEAFTRGQVNPFGMCFDPFGNLYNADCHSRPITQLLRGAYYSSFGKPHDGLGYGPDMIGHDHGSTALCGLTYYAADQFPPQYLDTMFLGNVVTNRINFDKIVFHGSTPQAVLQPDFLVSEDLWFRPVDIKLGPDGALYVADFYNRIIGHYEVPLDHPGRDRERGRIWRIVWKGTDGNAKPPEPLPDFTQDTDAALVHELGSPNLTRRLLATNQLVERGGRVKDLLRPILRDPGPVLAVARAHATWVMERLGGLDDNTLTTLARHPDALVRVHVMRVLAERADWSGENRTAVLNDLHDGNPLVVRCAADALGRHPKDPAELRALLDLRHEIPPADTHLLHVVRMALRDQIRYHMDRHHDLGARSKADWEALADVALGIPDAGSVSLLGDYLRKFPERTEQTARQVHQIVRYAPGKSPQHEGFINLIRSIDPGDRLFQFSLFQALQRAVQERGEQLPQEAWAWADDLGRQLLAAGAPAQARAGVELAASVRSRELERPLVDLAAQPNRPEDLKAAALGALATIDPAKYVPRLGQTLADAGEPVTFRERVAQALAGLNRTEASAELVKVLPTADSRLATAIAAGLAGTRGGAEQLLDAVKAGKASARLLRERAVRVKLDAAKVPNLNNRLAELTKGLPPVDQKLAQLLKRRRDGFLSARGDPALGAKVFTASCAACHQVGGQGAKVGPQLDGVGVRGVERLLEDILDPNRNVDQAFRATTIELKSGQVLSGLVLREEGEVVVLADAQGKEQRVAKGSVAERTVTTLSPMPANFDQSISEADLNHLLAYLLTLRPKDLPLGGR
jgi:putative heme-binding domain-containing protein